MTALPNKHTTMDSELLERFDRRILSSTVETTHIDNRWQSTAHSNLPKSSHHLAIFRLQPR